MQIKTLDPKSWTTKHYITTKNVLLKYQKTIGSHFKEIKVFMNYANDKGWTTNTAYLHKNFNVLEETSESISLDIQKIYKIYNLDLTGVHLRPT